MEIGKEGRCEVVTETRRQESLGLEIFVGGSSGSHGCSWIVCVFCVYVCVSVCLCRGVCEFGFLCECVCMCGWIESSRDGVFYLFL